MIEEPKMNTAMNNDAAETISLTMEDAKQKVELARKLDTLIANKEFDEIFTKGYLENEAVRIAGISCEPSMLTKENQEDLMGRMKAIGYFRQYVIFIRRQGDMAKRAIADCEAELDHMRSEALSDNSAE
jgi:hypothetical protein